MARNIAQIYNQMITEKETFSNLSNLSPTAQINPAQSLLTDLTSTSKVAIWRLIFYVVSVAIWIFENTIENEVSSSKSATVAWWVNVVKAFQYGDSLVWNGDEYIYQTIIPSHLIITQCAVNSANGIIYIKVATGTETLTPLTCTQLSALDAYIKLIAPLGTVYSIINNSADLLKIIYTVYIDPTIIYLNTSDPTDALNGSLIVNNTVFPIVDSINNYIQYLDALSFNGTFYVSNLTNAIRLTPGVFDAIAEEVKAKYGDLEYSNILATSSRSYITNSGYLAIDPSYPLINQNIIYLQQ
jgi:hypothetical protein